MATGGSNNFYALGVEPVLRIGGKEFPMVSFRVEYVLNGLPVAYVTVPSGYEMSNTPGNSRNILKLEDVEGRPSAQIVVKTRSATGMTAHPTGRAAPAGTGSSLIFDGYVAVTSSSIGKENVSTTLVLQHWLADLDLTAFAGGEFFPNAPEQWFTPRTPAMRVQCSGLVDIRGRTGTGDVSISPNTIIEGDLWTNTLRPALLYRLESVSSAGSAQVPQFVNVRGGTSTKALAALQNVSSIDLSLQQAVRSALSSAPNIRQSMFNSIVEVLYTTAGGNTIWTKLLALLGQFGLVVAPGVGTASVMAYSAAYTPTVTLTQNEFLLEGFSVNPSILPPGLVLYGRPAGQLTIRGGSTSVPDRKIDADFLGSFTATGAPADYLAGPIYTAPTPAIFWPSQDAPMDSDVQLNAPVITYGQGSKPKTVQPLTAPAKSQLTEVYDRVAQAAYFMEVFAAKSQDVRCPFRTDIATGACVELQGYNPALAGAGSDAWVRRGIVESVVYTFTAEPPAVYTTYRLKHTMDTREKTIFANYLSQQHPLFNGGANTRTL